MSSLQRVLQFRSLATLSVCWLCPAEHRTFQGGLAGGLRGWGCCISQPKGISTRVPMRRHRESLLNSL